MSLWHADESLGDVDAVIIPGGFSYGDYLRAGAISRFAPLMSKIIDAANSDAKLPVLGICNGFQILTESHLLPGSMIKNDHLKFICRDVTLRVRVPEQARAADPAKAAAGLLGGAIPGELVAGDERLESICRHRGVGAMVTVPAPALAAMTGDHLTQGRVGAVADGAAQAPAGGTWVAAPIARLRPAQGARVGRAHDGAPNSGLSCTMRAADAAVASSASRASSSSGLPPPSGEVPRRVPAPWRFHAS